MKTVLKIALGIILAFVVLIVGCAALFSAGVNEAQKDNDKTSITQAEYDSVKIGPNGNTRERLIERFGEPQSQQDIQSGEIEGIPDTASGMECIYYNREGKLASLYQFCVDTQTNRIQSKSAF